MSSWRASSIDDIAAEKWPYWAPIRHHFGITTFGINAWRGGAGDEVIKRHHESDSGHAELYFVLSGDALFTVGGEEVPGPAGTLLWVDDPAAERLAIATETNTVVLSISGGPPSGWDTAYLES
jgi:mannose-6-phosphate isomerase-like protein (cupin superfamily)